MNTRLELTGERTLPGIPHENYWFRRHEVAYLAVVPYCHDRRVLEAGCGEGYGGELLRSTARARVTALDYDEQAIGHVAATYPGLHAVRGNLAALPFTDGTFDVVVNLQVIEHLWDQPGFVRECARVLRPGGTLVMSTPNRLTFSPGTAPGERPLNPFHTRELDPAEMAELLKADFEVTSLLGVHHGPRITDWECEHGPIVGAQLAGPPESWSPTLAAIVGGLSAADFVLSQDDIEDSLDLIAIGVRP